MSLFEKFPNAEATDTLYLGVVSLFAIAAGWGGLLRGQGPSSPPFLVFVRLLLFFIFWYPVYRLNLYLGLLCFVYLPSYLDFSEFNGSRSSPWFQGSSIAKQFHWYFDCSLVKTSEVKEKQCILALHPHGVLPMAAVININTNLSGFESQFPHLKKRVIAAATMVSLSPLFRDLVLAVGVVDCSRYSFEELLKKGYTVGVFVGGAIEALYSNPHEVEALDLSRKKGFIRLSMIHNVPVVPCYTFNEVNHIYQISDSVISKFWLVSRVRRVFNRISGLILPFLFPFFIRGNNCVTVVGEAVRFKMKDGSTEPSEEELDQAMTEYTAILVKLYNDNAKKYNSRVERKIVIK